ncbi:hypothetical protein MLD38_012681 [Melastoma candidum]|uniref:Uncharacterized protein n=1 Tax=Melastoma candidum TaxID=119954 RepID=A0ACB9RBB1_9MYRT|nr:hypothetical protein MLD38_012681 [Melastoma candidum]
MEGGESTVSAKELEVAVKAVHLACGLCERVQRRLVSSRGVERGGTSPPIISSKDDDSPVTVADWGVQAIVSWLLSESFGSENVSIVAEEDVEALSESNSRGLLSAVVDAVNECLADAPRFELPKPDKILSDLDVVGAIKRCNATGGPKGRFWVLDPIDGTLGFVRGNQYAVALALMVDGKVVLGVLGCPNYPVNREFLSYHHQYYNTAQHSSTTANGLSEKGCVLYATRGSRKAWMQPLVRGENGFTWKGDARVIRVSSIDDPAMATICEPVEKANSDHTFTAGVADSVGLGNQPLRVYSMVKYAAIARGDAEVFMKFSRSGYKEKIWDHAAGVVIVEEAGGVMTDAGGRPLDFSRGVYLEGLDRGIIACCCPVLHEKIVGAVYASWESSNL